MMTVIEKTDIMEDGKLATESQIRLQGWRLQGDGKAVFEDCALLIPTYRRAKEVLRLLDRLLAMDGLPAEVMIIDGDPSGQLSEPLRGWGLCHKLPFELSYVRAPKGLTRQRNVGIELCNREFLFFVDDDAYPLPGYFAEIRRIFLEKRDVGAVGATIINEINRPMNRRWRLRLAIGLIPQGQPGKWMDCATSIPRSTEKPFTGTKEIDIIPGGASAWRREALEADRFSEFFEDYSQGEDVEMSLRVGKKWRVLSCGDAHLVHRPAPGGRPASWVKGRMEVRNRYFIWRRHTPSPSIANRLRFWGDIAFIAAMDVLWYLGKPNKFHFLGHAAGVLLGAAGCFVAPPRYEEPAPAKRYFFQAAPARTDR